MIRCAAVFLSASLVLLGGPPSATAQDVEPTQGQVVPNEPSDGQAPPETESQTEILDHHREQS